MAFQPVVGEELTIDGVTYRLAEHPAAPGMPYGQEGRQGVVYQLQAGSEARALKVFKPRYQVPGLAGLSRRLAPLADLPGLEVCRRIVLTPQHESDLLHRYPALTYAVLMPWIAGPTWMEVLLDPRPCTPEQSLTWARGLAEILCIMEQESLAHCDLSGPNLILPALLDSARRVPHAALTLVDIEQMYGPDLKRPDLLPGGSPGYAHRIARNGLWAADADRFAGAVLLAEMLGWCDARVRGGTWSESFFAPDELQQESARYTTLVAALRDRWGERVVQLLARAWQSDTLADCPNFGEWQIAIPEPPAVAVARPPSGPSARADAASMGLFDAARALEQQRNVAGALENYRKALAVAQPGSNLEQEIRLIVANLEAGLRATPPAPPQPAPQAVAARRGRPRSLWLVPLLLVLAVGAILLYLDDTQRQTRAATLAAAATAGAQSTATALAEQTAAAGAPTSATVASGRPQATTTAVAQATFRAQAAATTQAAAGATAARQATDAAGATATAQALATVVAQGAVAVILQLTADARATAVVISVQQTAVAQIQATATAEAAVRATAPPASLFPGTLAFAMHDRGDLWSLYTMRGTDAGPHRLDALDQVPGSKLDPVFSPDGSRLVFVQEAAATTRNLWLTDPTGSTLTQLTDSGHVDEDVCWSPDGGTIAFTTNRSSKSGGSYELWQMDNNGGNQHKTADTGGWCTWAPAPRLVWAALLPGAKSLNLFQSPGATPFLSDPPSDLDLPAWSPDGQHLAYVRGAPASAGKKDTREIWVLDTTSGDRQQLTFNTYADSNPVWVGNNSLLYITEAEGPGQRDIYKLDYKPGVVAAPRRVLTTSQTKFYLTWSP